MSCSATSSGCQAALRGRNVARLRSLVDRSRSGAAAAAAATTSATQILYGSAAAVTRATCDVSAPTSTSRPGARKPDQAPAECAATNQETPPRQPPGRSVSRRVEGGSSSSSSSSCSNSWSRSSSSPNWSALHQDQQRRGISFASDPFGALGAVGGGNPFGGGGSGRAPPRSKKLYDTLGVTENSSEKEIKAAYKKKALEHHPDRGGDADKFKDISKAYDVLGSPDKKKMYDLYGDAGLEQMEQAGAGAGGGGPQGFGHHDPFDMFRDIFGQNFQGGQQHPHANRRRKTQDIVQKMKLSLEEIYRGTTKDYQLTRHVLCEYCGGHGGSEVRACSTCGGSGRIEQQQRMGPFVQFVQSECPKCNGEGMVVPPGKQCKPCRGKGITEKKEFFQIQVPRTATTGFVQKFEGKADEVLNCETGDLIFVVEEQRHPVYHRIGQDLMIKKTLPLQDALCGFRFKLRFLDEREIIVESAPGQVVKPNDIWRIPGKGMPTSNGTYGDLVVRFEVLFPSALASEKSDQGTRNTLAKLGLDKSFYFAGEVDGDEGGGEKGSGAG
eukprot:CAMPEP_0179002236 /NCGR_PEP_ID=MMETSP0795-20121207/11872_1 /TAXON_ID=88552 /ORGANISM="Amoebophrya sp., Strain Ameob2" /LENGTH=553 /DNA_ID=CAMNT_0020695835 /DNA_START=1232 /DNA_END=2891 /DNA_ORIENTATION=+